MGHKLYSIKGSAAAILAAAILAVLGVAAAMVAPAHAAPLDATCPVQFAAPIYTCDTMPVGIQTNHSSDSSFSSHIKIVVKTTLAAQIKQYASLRHVIVTIDQVPGGVKSLAGCIDPVAKGYIKPGGYFSNTGGRINWRFTDKWKAGDHICDAHVVHGSDGSEYLDGTKGSCGNKHIHIYLTPHQFTKYVPVARFITTASFTSTYEKWVTGFKHSTGTSTRDTEYYCRVAGYNPGVVNGREVCYHVVQIPGTPTPTPTPTGPIVCSNIGNNNGGNCNVTTTTSVTTPTVTVTTPVTTTAPTPVSCSLSLSEAKGDQTVTASIGVSGGTATHTDFIWGDGAEDPGSQMAVQHTYAALAPAPAGTYTSRTISAKAVVNGNWVDCGSKTYLQANPPTNPTGTNPNDPPALPNG